MSGEVGADISYFQSFNAAQYTYPFIFIRATFGASMIDPKFASYRAAARAKPIPYRAYYWFIVADVDVQTQFALFASTVGNLTPGENVMLDDEAYADTGGLPSRAQVQEAAQLCQQRWGIWPIHYSLASVGRIANCPQTNASYSGANPGGDFWQYTDGQRDYGAGLPISAGGVGNCDMNRCNGNLASYFLGAAPAAAPAPAPKRPSNNNEENGMFAVVTAADATKSGAGYIIPDCYDAADGSVVTWFCICATDADADVAFMAWGKGGNWLGEKEQTVKAPVYGTSGPVVWSFTGKDILDLTGPYTAGILVKSGGPVHVTQRLQWA